MSGTTTTKREITYCGSSIDAILSKFEVGKLYQVDTHRATSIYKKSSNPRREPFIEKILLSADGPFIWLGESAIGCPMQFYDQESKTWEKCDCALKYASILLSNEVWGIVVGPDLPKILKKVTPATNAGTGL